MVHVHFTPKMKLNYCDWFDGVQSMWKTRQDNDVTDCIGVINAKIRNKPSWLIRQVQSIMKTRQDDDITNHKDVISTEYDIEMLRLKG